MSAAKYNRLYDKYLAKCSELLNVEILLQAQQEKVAELETILGLHNDNLEKAKSEGDND